MKKESIWTNKDGLYVGFGTRAVEQNAAAKITAGDGQESTVVLKIVGTDLQATNAKTAHLANGVIIPAGSQIERVRLVVNTQFAGTSALLDVGAYDTADAIVDVDGFCDAVTVATLVTGYSADFETTGGGGFDGDLIKTILAADTKVGASLGDSNVFTDGVATVYITYTRPAN